VIFAEYAIDTARECRAVGVRNVAVTAGYITPVARGPFFEFMDAANVDLKAFTEEFYYKLTYSHLQPVLDTLTWLRRETNVWIEITNLVIPQANDSQDEIRSMCDWILEHVGDAVPLHFSAFHPDFRMHDRAATPHETLLAAREVALQQGVKYVYTGNVDDVSTQSTYCPQCRGLLIERNWYDLGQYHLRGDRCGHCGHTIAGVFEDGPGSWGRKRLPVRISQFARPLPAASPPADREDPTANPPVTQSKESSDMTSENPSAGDSPRIEAQRPKLSSDQEQQIHAAACEIMAAAVTRRAENIADRTLAGAADRTVLGAFVTLKRDGRLRACCGALGRPMPVGAALVQAALRTATEDTRLPTISPTELEFLEVDVSLLYGFVTIEAKGQDRIQAVEVGRHGLQIQRGQAGGLLLPSVATEQGYQAEEFLRQVCRKAGLPSTAWQEDESVIQTFEAASIAGPFAPAALGTPAPPAPLLTRDELIQLGGHCGRNLGALLQGATPFTYLPGCSDGTVNVVTLSLKPSGAEDAVHFYRFALRPGMPLQSTLYGVTEAAANAIRSGRLRLAEGQVQIAVSVLFDPAMHGSVAAPDLRGIDPAQRAVFVIEGAKSAWAYDPGKSPEQLLQEACEAIRVFSPEAAGVFSFAVQTTEPALLVSSAPQPWEGAKVRPAAVAGSFYPADTAALTDMVDGFLQDGPKKSKAWPAVMVPHAGLIYSGQIATRVFQHVKIPDTVIIICPKHTRLGVEWAVAPHEQWALPGATLAGDTELARQLAESIPGLELDAAAHQQEHAIEVQLPLLARLAPETKVVAIAVGPGADLARCREFANGLANVIKGLKPQPLLVISSDLNHYAADAENRRLDEIALQAAEKLDPEHLYTTVMDHRISMCGVRPAVMVMETLKELGGLKKCERVGYATSAEVGGDANRVVGYAGMLIS
jgi:AmmeMemoRadiSam system protein B/AmmeMemoRadiSam system protein A